MQRGTGAADAVGATAIRLGATDAVSIAATVQRVRDEAGSLDVLVNNAGIAGDQRPLARGPCKTCAVYETNVFGATAVLDAFIPLLEASTAPVVVNVSSAVGSPALNSSPDTRWRLLAYPMSKAALNMLTIQLARAYPRWRVNWATPGLTATEFTQPRDDGPTIEQMRSAGVQVNTVGKGAEIIVRMALLEPDGLTGTFFGNDGLVPW